MARQVILILGTETGQCNEERPPSILSACLKNIWDIWALKSWRGYGHMKLLRKIGLILGTETGLCNEERLPSILSARLKYLRYFRYLRLYGLVISVEFNPASF